MAHPEQLKFVERVKQHAGSFFCKQRVLEVGSLDLNGSVRIFFEECDYVGVDVAPGKGVDLVCQGQLVDHPTGHYDVVISCEAMEHNPYWVETTANMLRLCRPGGLFILSCASHGRAEHGTTRTNPVDSPLTVGLKWDYYRNLAAADFENALPLDRWFATHRFFQNWNSYDLLLVGIRGGSEGSFDLAPAYASVAEMVRPQDERLVMKRKLAFRLLGDKGLHALRGRG